MARIKCRWIVFWLVMFLLYIYSRLIGTTTDSLRTPSRSRMQQDLSQEETKQPGSQPVSTIQTNRNTSSHQFPPQGIVFKPIPFGLPRENILTMDPPVFLPDFKNPCWMENRTLRCLPYFYLAGVAKSGTTDLYHRITQHPHVLTLEKENHWWVRTRFSRNKEDGSVIEGKSFERYTSFYPLEALAKKQRPNITDWHNYYIMGDGSATTICNNFLWPRLAEEQEGKPPPYDEPKDTQHTVYYIHHLQPQAKFIVILRNPITRLYSAYYYWHKKPDPATFHELVANKTKIVGKCLDLRSLGACTHDYGLHKLYQIPLSMSFYIVHLLEWFKHYPKEQLLVLRMEDPVLYNLRQAYSFLNLKSLPDDEMRRISLTKHKNQVKKQKKKMFPDTWKLLQNFYRPYNKQLASFLGDEKYLWENDSQSVQTISYSEYIKTRPLPELS